VTNYGAIRPMTCDRTAGRGFQGWPETYPTLSSSASRVAALIGGTARSAPHIVRAAVVTLAVMLSAACDRFMGVSGIVQDSAGRPIAGADIHFTSMHEYFRTVSAADGCFDVGGGTDPNDSYEPLTVVLIGYREGFLRVPVDTPNNHRVLVILSPVDSSAPSRVQLLAATDKQSLARCETHQGPSR
jgi:hypothetical protein